MVAMHLNYGGTFDPVHNGHLAVARSAAERFGAVVHLVPAADPPHRARPGATGAQRAEMLRLAIDGDPRLAVDLRELRRDGASYTIDTLRELRAELGPGRPIALLIGADAFVALETWRGWRELFELAHIVVLTRPGHSIEQAPPALAAEVARRKASTVDDLQQSPAGRVLPLQVPAWPVSSTVIRAEIAAERPLDGLVPPSVAAYVQSLGLYR